MFAWVVIAVMISSKAAKGQSSTRQIQNGSMVPIDSSEGKLNIRIADLI